jgi:hypothetical protein
MPWRERRASRGRCEVKIYAYIVLLF